jgi:uncharacterized membrane protein
MATSGYSAVANRSYAKPLLWSAFGLMLLSVFVFYDLPLFRPTNPHHARMVAARFILVPHALTAITTMVLGAIQFSSRLRRRNMSRHRLLGKVYVVSVLIAAPTAAMLAFRGPGHLPFAGAVQATAWVICTLAAFLAARNRQIIQHKQWMVRSYGVGCTIFAFTRITNPIAYFQWITPDDLTAEIFLFMILALLIPEIVWSWKAISPNTEKWV